MKGGVYIVKYSDNSIKIGKSKNVYKRLQSYKGYQMYGQAVEKLLIIYCEENYINDLEKWSHCYAETKNLTRINKCEVFQTDDIQQFITLIKRDIKEIFTDKVTIQDEFNQQQYTFQKQQQSNLQGNKEKSQQKQLEMIQNKINNLSIANGNMPLRKNIHQEINPPTIINNTSKMSNKSSSEQNQLLNSNRKHSNKSDNQRYQFRENRQIDQFSENRQVDQLKVQQSTIYEEEKTSYKGSISFVNNDFGTPIQQIEHSEDLRSISELDECKESPIFQYMNQFKYGYSRQIKPKQYFYQQAQKSLGGLTESITSQLGSLSIQDFGN